jgi:hypothetical protein
VRRILNAVLLCSLTSSLAGLGCAHIRGGGDQDDAEHQQELYCKALHWKDYDAGSLLLFVDQRADWRRARDKLHDERDLSVTACDLREMRLNATKDAAQAFVKISWYRLPESVEKTEEAEERWIYRGGKWQLFEEHGGPMGKPLDAPWGKPPPLTAK